MFGISTHLYLDDRLDRDHLVEIAAHGFDAIEVFAVASHFDYHDRRAAVALAEWLDDTRLTLHSCTRRLRATTSTATWGEALRLAAADEARAQGGGRRDAGGARRRRGGAVLARWSSTAACRNRTAAAADNHRALAGRSLEELSPVAQRSACGWRRSDSQCAVDAAALVDADRKRHRCAPTSASAWTSATRA